MKEHGIIFCGEMVRATLDGRKTQTRRLARDAIQSIPGLYYRHCGNGLWAGYMPPGEPAAVPEMRSPYGKPGDRLWVRETTREDVVGSESMTTFVADGWSPRIRWNYSRRTRPAIHLPKKLARIWLEVTGIRVERLQDISGDDCRAEGIQVPVDKETGNILLRLTGKHPPCRYITLQDRDPRRPTIDDFFRAHYASLWDDLNHARGYSWESNPQVWVITFKRLSK